MAGSDQNYEVVCRGEHLSYYKPGGWVFFQRPKENGGGYWLGRTYDGVFLLEFTHLVSLSQGLMYLLELARPVADTESVASQINQPGTNFPLF